MLLVTQMFQEISKCFKKKMKKNHIKLIKMFFFNYLVKFHKLKNVFILFFSCISDTKSSVFRLINVEIVFYYTVSTN